MATNATADEQVAPITLYFALRQGERADLEVAARAAIAFAEAIKELAEQFDPFAEVRVELESGSDSSLGLNALIRKIRGFIGANPGWAAFLASVAFQLAGDLRQWTVGEVLDALNGRDAPEEVRKLSEQEKKEIAEEVVTRLQRGQTKAPMRRVFREAMKDPAIEGIGVTAKRATRPAMIIPREQFAQAAGEVPIEQLDARHRVTTERLRTVLKRPRLEAIYASWRFQVGSLPEFSAEMRDKDFLRAFEEGRIDLKLEIGAEMEIELATEEEFEGGVWVPKRRAVTRVFSPEARPSPLGLFPDQ